MPLKTNKRFLAGIVSGSYGYKTYGTGVTRKAIPKPKAKPRLPGRKTAQERRKARPNSSSKNSDSKSPGSRRRRASRR
tara:strand:+ start:11574 stop:11807 length:234 start_codon:yes stop_codon:yes gene_type:complete